MPIQQNWSAVAPNKNDDKGDTYSSEEETVDASRPDVEELRRIRAEFYTISPEERRTRNQKGMAERAPPRRGSSAWKAPDRVSEVAVQEVRKVEYHHRRRRTRGEEKDSEREHVYVHRSKPAVSESPPLRRSKTTATAATSRPKEVRRGSEGLARSHSGRQKLRPGENVVSVKRVVHTNLHQDPRDPEKYTHRRQSMNRSASTRERTSGNHPTPALIRSQTTTRKVRPAPPVIPPSREKIEPTPSATRSAPRPSSFFGSILGIPRAPPAPEKQVECLTCLSTYPASRTARLACTHRMCHACLRRIFTLSITDPQHMPPKCCTADHIPLKHVEKLFDMKFKMKWNAKYREYTAENRLYCPRRGCGEWIKPKDIHTDTGRKYGKCGRCKTKICTACNGRWHASRACPKDDATKQFIEIAKREGWQRCYNCSATVELKEGCNHMTCRCKAEFCMICGVKWKGCDCPWFNYETVEQDRLNHMNIPINRRVVVVDGEELHADHPRAARGYQAELDARREQERRDEQLARRLQTLGIYAPGQGVEAYQVIDDHDAEEDSFGVGNTAGYHLNTHFVSYPTSQPTRPPPVPRQQQQQQQQQQLPPLLRQHSRASRAYNNQPTTRPPERVVPGRSAIDYAHEAAVHAPLRSATVGTAGPGREVRRRAGSGGVSNRMAGVGNGFDDLSEPETPRGSALAGLTHGKTAEERVEEWRSWVESVG
ncbi:MAG: hypothetical protein Q9179_005726 [Wetmoreana sp. 5 TL-2023]